jgi:hypothetical protein
LAVSCAILVGWPVGDPNLFALYLEPDLENIPVSRLIENLEALAKKDEKAVAPRQNLARVHAMAYALKTDTAQVQKGKQDQGAWFGFEPRYIPFEVKKTEDEAKIKAANEHLDKALERYKGVIKLDEKNLVAKLGLAWCLDQAKKKDQAIKEYRAVVEEAWAKEKDLKFGDLGGHYITAEAAGYLIPLLDSEKNKNEIATLKNRTKTLEALPRPVTPIVVPLRDGLTVKDLEDKSASVAFDADGSGLKQSWSWITPEAGWLVFDARKTGKITSGLQLFGNVTFWCFWENGYEALRSLDDNGDGILTGKELDGLAIWCDANGNGICDPGEVRPLSDYGIVAISCRCRRDDNHPDKIMYSPEGVTFRDGSTRPTYDIILKHRPPPRSVVLTSRTEEKPIDEALVKALKDADTVFKGKIDKVKPLGQTNSIPPSTFGEITFKDTEALRGKIPNGKFSYSFREGKKNFDLEAKDEVIVALQKTGVTLIIPASEANLLLVKKTAEDGKPPEK